LSYRFTPSHRGGSGPPLVALHGFLDTWRTWELVLPALERHHDVLAPTLAGHAGGPARPAGAGTRALTDAVEVAMDDAGVDTAHLVGNSLGGFLAFELAARGRAEAVVALAPAGAAPASTLARQVGGRRSAGRARPARRRDRRDGRGPEAGDTARQRALPAHPAGLDRTSRHGGRRVPECGAAARRGDGGGVAARARPYRLLRADRLWHQGPPAALAAAAARFREKLPLAAWDVLDGVGHRPQLDVPEITAELILATTVR
jgi:pimeloyl-ACP methyl ester carboxylesterase